MSIGDKGIVMSNDSDLDARYIDGTIKKYCRNYYKHRKELLFANFDEAKSTCSLCVNGCI